MCCNLIVVVDCVCNNRILEVYEIKKDCDCIKNVLFQKLEMSFCPLCENSLDILDKLFNIIEHFVLKEEDVELYYNESPFLCTERVFR